MVDGVRRNSSVYSGDCLNALREKLTKTFDSSQLPRSIHSGETRTFFPGHQFSVLTSGYPVAIVSVQAGLRGVGGWMEKMFAARAMSSHGHFTPVLVDCVRRFHPRESHLAFLPSPRKRAEILQAPRRESRCCHVACQHPRRCAKIGLVDFL